MINPLSGESDDFMPLGLYILSSLVTPDYHVFIYKPKIKLIKAGDYVSAAKDILKANPSLIGFSTWCITYPALLLVAREIKRIGPHLPIVFGGPQASILAHETLTAFPFIDFILTGEAEKSFPAFVDAFFKGTDDLEKVPGLVFRNQNGEIIQNQAAEPVQNADELPYPDYNCYPHTKVIKLDVGRGCPFHCTFCSTNDFFSKKYRLKSANRIISEMLMYNKEAGIKTFAFIHDMFTLNRRTVLELCSHLFDLQKSRGLFLKWSCSARTDCVTAELLTTMKQAGCNAIFFGIESGSEKIQQSIRKNLNIGNVIELADHCNEIGMKMFASFIIGFPDETRSDIEKTLKCIARLAIKGVFVQVSELSLLPGTPLYEKYKDKIKFDGNFSNFSKTLCGPEEIKLISDHPHIFSSFYYLPVKAIRRNKIVFINQLINKISLFRNTLKLLAGLLEDEIEPNKLLEMAEREYDLIVSGNQTQTPVVSHLIRIIGNIIRERKAETEMPYLMSIFNYESYQALLKTVYSGWQHFKTKTGKEKLTPESIINPTPLWKTVTTSVDAEKIISYLNKPLKRKLNLKPGRFHYLMVATSEKVCKTQKINEQEFFLLNNLSQISVRSYAEMVKPVLGEKELLLWLQKLKRLNIIGIVPEPVI